VCNGKTYAMDCTGTACTCKTDGGQTSTFTGTGMCNDFATCGYP
jgi:hypothetical protein